MGVTSTSLSAIMIAMLVALFVMTTSFGVYTNFVIDNNGSYDPDYAVFYGEIDTAYDNTIAEADEIGLRDKVTGILTRTSGVLFGAVNIFVIGLSSIGTFFNLIPIVNTLIQAITQIFPQFRALLGLLTVIFGFWLGMRFIKSARGSTEDI